MSGLAVKAPIILVHGILGFDHLQLGLLDLPYFRGIPAALRALGNRVPEPPALSPTGGVAKRAAELADFLNNTSVVPPGPVHLIAHSMGGLDALHLIARTNARSRILSLTTLGTPFRGSPLANINAAVFGPALEVLGLTGVLDVQAFFDLTHDHASEFLAEGIQAEELGPIPRFCVAGRYQPGLLSFGLLTGTRALIEPLQGDNDGVVSVASATAFGQLLGHWGANHFRLINWPSDLVVPISDFNDHTIISGYVGLVQNLVAHGF